MSKLKNDIERYLRGEMTPAEMHQLEKRALNDHFLAEAIEGAESIGAEKFSDDLASLHNQIASKQKRQWITPLRIAAGFLVLAAASFSVYFLLRPDAMPPSLAAVQQKKIERPVEKEVEREKITEPQKLKRDVLTENAGSAAEKKSVAERKPATLASSATVRQSEPAASLPDEKVAGKAGELEVAENADSVEVIDLAAPGKSVVAAGPRLTTVARQPLEEPSTEFRSRAGSKHMIRGKVSLADRSSASGVTIAGKQSGTAVQTDEKGNFEIQSDPENESLIFSRDGVIKSEVDAGDASSLDIQLASDSAKAEEVVVTGSGGARDYDHFDLTTEFAQPVGGNRAFNIYLDKNLRYPAEAKENKTEGRVTIGFKVHRDGSLTDFIVIHGLTGGCNEELIRLIKEGPKWNPLKQKGETFDSNVSVRLKFVLPRK